MAMKRKRIKLKYKKERVLFCDVLPYELPFIFTNRYFYRFLVKNQIRLENDKLYWGSNIEKGALALLAFLFNTSVEQMKRDGNSDFSSKNIHKLKRIPFVYKILHKPNKFRELTVINPVNQIQMVDFYDKYRSLMMYYTNLDRFSLRHPGKVACFFYYKDRLHHTLLGRKTDKLELFFNEYENLRTYFSYKKYNNIYKFYEDYRYQRAEKKFEHLLKFDIQSCFDSIYTHSIAWATGGGRDYYKENFKGSDNSFASTWDKLMELMNYNETNGIVIGPEFSRIFAEVILQHVDVRVETELRILGFKANKDFECYRYVDDYFFYYNDNTVVERAMVLFANVLKEFKLSISSEKTTEFNRPFVTDITRAKIQIDELVNNYLKFHQDDIIQEAEEEDIDNSTETEDVVIIEPIDLQRIQSALSDRGYLQHKADDFNTKFKAIIKSCSVESKDVVNYTLARIDSKMVTALKKFDQSFKVLSKAMIDENFADKHHDCLITKIKKERMLCRYLLSLLDSVFFLYAGNKRVNTTLKVISILNDIIIMLDNHYIDNKREVKRFSDFIRDNVYKKLQDEISLVFQTSDLDENAQLETMYFLIILRRLKNKYHLSALELEKYIGVVKNDGKIKRYPKLNALSIIILLYYIGNEGRYNGIKKDCMEYVKGKFDSISEAVRPIKTELVILTLDLLACPYISNEDKKSICDIMNISDEDMKSILRYFKCNRYMFTKWDGVDITKELNAKISQEVYS